MRISDWSSDVCSSDLHDVNLSDPAQALRLKAYIWPEHHIRFERMEAAIAAAPEAKPNLVHAHAADFVETALAKPQAAGTTRGRKSVVAGQRVSVRVDLGGRRRIKKTKSYPRKKKRQTTRARE